MATRNIVPRLSNEGQIGTATKQWSDGFFINFHVDGITMTGKKAIPEVDSTNHLGDATHRFHSIYAVNMIGTASIAKYADLAENYSCAQETLPEGTVMSISELPSVDVEVCNDDACDCVVGVVSKSPAYTMNGDQKGPSVALVGRVPVRVVGPIKKQQAIVSASGGVARAAEGNSDYMFKFGFSLEENLNSEEKLVMCLIK
jgi:hypothetical protein